MDRDADKDGAEIPTCVCTNTQRTPCEQKGPDWDTPEAKKCQAQLGHPQQLGEGYKQIVPPKEAILLHTLVSDFQPL